MLGVDRQVYYVELSLNAHPASTLEAQMDPIMEALEHVDGVQDADIGVDLEEARMDVCMYVPARSNAEAIEIAVTALRTAIHEIGGHTPDWEGPIDGPVAEAVDSESFETRSKRADLTCA